MGQTVCVGSFSTPTLDSTYANNISCPTLGLPKGLVFAHVNVCSLRNKTHEIERIIRGNDINIFAISETHLDDSIPDSAVNIDGFSLVRKDRTISGGGVGIFCRSDAHVKVRTDLMRDNIEAVCVQVHQPFLKPFIVCLIARLFVFFCLLIFLIIDLREVKPHSLSFFYGARPEKIGLLPQRS